VCLSGWGHLGLLTFRCGINNEWFCTEHAHSVHGPEEKQSAAIRNGCAAKTKASALTTSSVKCCESKHKQHH
jgi:hypothetical protein